MISSRCLSITAIITLTLSLGACGEGGDSAPAASSPAETAVGSSSTETATQLPADVGDMIDEAADTAAAMATEEGQALIEEAKEAATEAAGEALEDVEADALEAAQDKAEEAMGDLPGFSN